jgi:hypothetical protein
MNFEIWRSLDVDLATATMVGHSVATLQIFAVALRRFIVAACVTAHESPEIVTTHAKATKRRNARRRMSTIPRTP